MAGHFASVCKTSWYKQEEDNTQKQGSHRKLNCLEEEEQGLGKVKRVDQNVGSVTQRSFHRPGII